MLMTFHQILLGSSQVACFCRYVAMMIVISVGLGSGPVLADKPLTLNDCKALEADKADAVQQGLAKDLARGPEWAKANLGAERLREILRLIEIEELLNFRCVKVFKIAAEEKNRRDREAARRKGIIIPPLPSKNPKRAASLNASSLQAR
ncbi:MAG: hypothetical protein ACRBCJ_01155 [Hyphomicrobiaceae bacterium]